MPEVITRFPPSPTGHLHLGSARTALFNFLFARQHGGKIYLRFEDTDRTRSKPEFEISIRQDLDWLGIVFDNETPWRQSERGEIYRRYIGELIAGGRAYEDGGAVRFRNPNARITFQDVIRGEISFDTDELKDFVIAKSLAEPLYHLAVVLDDAEMGVTHVIRGEDHLSNTPRQILLQEALGLARPQYAHLPLIIAVDRTKLSKRHGAVAVGEYRQAGYLPAALINFLALLGWSPQAQNLNQNIFNLENLTRYFKLNDVQRSPAVCDLARLDWFNREHIKLLSLTDSIKWIRAFLPPAIANLPGFNEAMLAKLAPELKTRLRRFRDVSEMGERGELNFFFQRPALDKKLLRTVIHLGALADRLASIDDQNFTVEKIREAVFDYATGQNKGEILWPMRTALTGLEKSPDPFTVAAILGKQETIVRLRHAQNI